MPQSPKIETHRLQRKILRCSNHAMLGHVACLATLGFHNSKCIPTIPPSPPLLPRCTEGVFVYNSTSNITYQRYITVEALIGLDGPKFNISPANLNFLRPACSIGLKMIEVNYPNELGLLHVNK